MNKLFALPYASKVKNSDFNRTWELEEVSAEKMVVKVSMPADQPAGMVKNSAVVWMAFERE